MILVGGEALIDLVADPSTSDGTAGDERLRPLLPMPGGGPYNVAVATGRLGVPTGFLSRISTDMFGAALLDRLTASHVDTSLLQRGDEPTTLAVAGIGPDGGARYSFHVEGTADRLVTDPGPLPDAVRVLSLGTLSLVLEPGASVYEELLRRAAGAGVLTVLDPNIRPALITDPAGYRARFLGWLEHIDVLKVSVEDARWLADLGADTDADAVLDVVRGWQADGGPSAVVFTRGGDGLAALTADGEYLTVPAVEVTVVDTIGAGDTVHGAVLAWLYRAGATTTGAVSALGPEDWRDAVSFAARAAAITCSRRGAEPPFADELA